MGRVIIACLLALAMAPFSARAGGTLDRIKTQGTMVLGVRESSIPISYLDQRQQPQGYHVDICARLAQAVKARLSLPELTIRYQTVTAQTRIPMLTSGGTDLDCGTTSISGTRESQVAFAPATFISSVRMVVAKDSGLSSMAGLNGKTVVTTAGTTSVGLLRALESEEKLVFRTHYGKDHQESFDMVRKGAADAFIMDEYLLMGEVIASGTPERFLITGEVLKTKQLALMYRKGDPDFAALVDGAIRQMAANGELDRLYAKWFSAPIPPAGINLNYPMGPAMAGQIKALAGAHPSGKAGTQP